VAGLAGVIGLIFHFAPTAPCARVSRGYPRNQDA
jgi:hypothetical protein